MVAFVTNYYCWVSNRGGSGGYIWIVEIRSRVQNQELSHAETNNQNMKLLNKIKLKKKKKYYLKSSSPLPIVPFRDYSLYACSSV